jgi:hypothetical protein
MKQNLINLLLNKKADLDNKIDLDAYTKGLTDMFEHFESNPVNRLVQDCEKFWSICDVRDL